MGMLRIVEQAAGCGILEEDLRFARVVIEEALEKTPTNGEESIDMWHKVVARCEVEKLPMSACSQFIAAMAWREGHLILVGETGERRRWWRREASDLVVETRSWA